MRFILYILLLPIILYAQNYEERFYKDKNHHPSNISIHTDLGFSSYMVELDSSELDSSIDYDILEFTLGVSYSYDNWMWGVYTKLLANEIQSNMNITTTGKNLNDHADIDKKEFALYTNYTLEQNDKYTWRVNGIYRYAILDAIDSYISYNQYSSLFKYETNGLALSLDYSYLYTDNSSWFINYGFVYTQAIVKASESIKNHLQDSFVDSSSNAFGQKISIGYNYQIRPHTFINFRVDFWKLDFDKLKVKSRVGDTLPKASLQEQSFSSYIGISYAFGD